MMQQYGQQQDMARYNGQHNMDIGLDGSETDDGENDNRRNWVRWSAEEHQKLAELVRKHGVNRSWSMIAAHIPGRTGKQCRERWLNHTNEGTKKGNWSSREEYILATQHSLCGSQWCRISRYLPGRTDNSVKNHWNATWRSKVMHKPQSILWLYSSEMKAGQQPASALRSALLKWENNVAAHQVMDVLGFWPSQQQHVATSKLFKVTYQKVASEYDEDGEPLEAPQHNAIMPAQLANMDVPPQFNMQPNAPDGGVAAPIKEEPIPLPSLEGAPTQPQVLAVAAPQQQQPTASQQVRKRSSDDSSLSKAQGPQGGMLSTRPSGSQPQVLMSVNHVQFDTNAGQARGTAPHSPGSRSENSSGLARRSAGQLGQRFSGQLASADAAAAAGQTNNAPVRRGSLPTRHSNSQDSRPTVMLDPSQQHMLASAALPAGAKLSGSQVMLAPQQLLGNGGGFELPQQMQQLLAGGQTVQMANGQVVQILGGVSGNGMSQQVHQAPQGLIWQQGPNGAVQLVTAPATEQLTMAGNGGGQWVWSNNMEPQQQMQAGQVLIGGGNGLMQAQAFGGQMSQLLGGMQQQVVSVAPNGLMQLQALLSGNASGGQETDQQLLQQAALQQLQQLSQPQHQIIGNGNSNGNNSFHQLPLSVMQSPGGGLVLGMAPSSGQISIHNGIMQNGGDNNGSGGLLLQPQWGGLQVGHSAGQVMLGANGNNGTIQASNRVSVSGAVADEGSAAAAAGAGAPAGNGGVNLMLGPAEQQALLRALLAQQGINAVLTR